MKFLVFFESPQVSPKFQANPEPEEGVAGVDAQNVSGFVAKAAQDPEGEGSLGLRE